MFGDNLKAMRKAKGYTQEELAIKLNVVRQTVSKWEKGLSVPDADALSKIADVLDTKVSILLGGTVRLRWDSPTLQTSPILLCRRGVIEKMNNAIIYIHGKDGNAAEAEHYGCLFPDCDVIGFDYKAETPWDAKDEFPAYFDALRRKYESVCLVANSIGAFFAMTALGDREIEKAYFISPVVDMEQLISDMMMWADVTENELREKWEIRTTFGEALSWEYLCYVREHPVKWGVPTHVLYGEKDHLTSFETMSAFAKKTGAVLTVMPGGEHWFHTEEQVAYLDEWIRETVRGQSKSDRLEKQESASK